MSSRPGQTKEKEHGRLQQLKLNQLGTTEFRLCELIRSIDSFGFGIIFNFSFFSLELLDLDENIILKRKRD